MHEPGRSVQRLDSLDEDARVDPAACVRGRREDRAESFSAKPSDQHGDPLIERLESGVGSRARLDILKIGSQPAAKQSHHIGGGPKQNRCCGEFAPARTEFRSAESGCLRQEIARRLTAEPHDRVDDSFNLFRLFDHLEQVRHGIDQLIDG